MSMKTGMNVCERGSRDNEMKIHASNRLCLLSVEFWNRDAMARTDATATAPSTQPCYRKTENSDPQWPGCSVSSNWSNEPPSMQNYEGLCKFVQNM